MITPATLTPEQWRSIDELFGRALELPAEERAAFLARECDDPIVAGEVSSLLASSAGGDELQRIVGAVAGRLRGDQIAAQSGRKVGPYRLIAPIGEGGMGVVFRAERDDAEFKRDVAIKILRHGFGSAEAIARFRDERQILAGLEHPGIVRMLDGGTTDDGLPYIVMEWIRGVPITKFARDRELTIRARVELMVQVCNALHHAHGKHVVHRDIKPSNILVAEDGTPKILDFGIATLVGPEAAAAREARTRTGMALLTPEYASPEQARGETVTVATDIYSLGAVLFELITGEPPQHPVGSPLELLHAICDVDPPRPSAVVPAQRRELAGDLDNIVLKALAKETGRRYASVANVAEDLRRYLEGRPVLARTPALGYRARKLIVRHRGKLAAGMSLILASGAVAVVLTRGGAVEKPAAPTTDDCVLGRQRLAGIWDAATRGKIGERFAKVQRAEVPAVWRTIATDLDTYTNRWAAQWDEVCKGPDRSGDPLLYGQRVTCLENAMLAIRGLGQSLAIGDLGELVEGVTYDFVDANVPALVDCTDVRRLREQRPAPPPDKRIEIVALGAEWRLARAGFRRGANAGKMSGVDDALARMGRVAARLAELGVFGASETNLVGSYLVNLAVGEPSQFSTGIPARIPQARRALDEAIHRAETSRDDSVLADSLAELARLQVATGEATTAVEATLARGEAALRRAGRAKHPTLIWVRSEVMIRDGNPAAAIDLLRSQLPTSGVRPEAWLNVAHALSRTGQHDEAIAECRKLVALYVTKLGEIHLQSAYARAHLATFLENAGDRDAALAELERVEEIYDRIGEVVIDKRRAVWTREHALAKALGRTTVAERVRAKLAANR